MKVKDFHYLHQNPKHHNTLAVSKVVGVKHRKTGIVVPAVICHESSDSRFRYMVLALVNKPNQTILRPYFDQLRDNAGQWYGYGSGHCQMALCHFQRPNEYRIYCRDSEMDWAHPHWHTTRLVASMALAHNGFKFAKPVVQCVQDRLEGLLHVAVNDWYRGRIKERLYCNCL